MAFSEEFYRYYCRDCWPPRPLSRPLSSEERTMTTTTTQDRTTTPTKEIQ